jgi:nitrous oxidase accessory protein NosD
MKKAVTLLVLALLFSAVAGTQIVKKARAQTITVPDDYATIQDAINAANDGDIIFVRSGVYEGPINQTLVISKPLSLIGEDANSTKLSLHPPLVPMSIFTYTYMGYSDPIEVNANDFNLSGFTITTLGGGISITGNRTQITGNNITTGLSVNGSNSTIAMNTLAGRISLDGSHHTIAQNKAGSIYCSGSYNSIAANSIVGPSAEDLIYLAGPYNIVFENTIKSVSNGRVGVNVRSDGNIVAHNNITSCPGAGIETEHGQNNVFCANRITNCGAGFSLAGNNVTVYANYVANNEYGAMIAIGGQKTLFHNNFVDNNQHVGFGRGYELTVWDNGKEGNYWSKYSGADWNFDGIGDTPYVINENNQDRYPLMAPFDISSVTVELPEWASPLQSPSPSPSQEPTSSAPLPTALAIALVITITVEGIGLLIYFKKRKR